MKNDRLKNIMVGIAQHKRTLFLILFLFTSISLVVRFFEFDAQTGAYDLGIEAGTARNIVFNHSFFDPVMNMNLLGDHFEPALALPGLLFYLWDNAAVIILFQNVCVFLSIYLGYVLAKKILQNELTALFLSILFVFNSHLRVAAMFPFHIEIVAMPLFFLLLLLIEQEQRAHKLFVLIISLLMCTIKEDVPLTLAVFGFWVVLFKKEKRAEGVIMLFVGMSAFLIITMYLLPHFSGGEYTHLSRYSNLGSTREEIVKTILLRPDRVFLGLITPVDKIKYFLLLFLQFAYLPFIAPTYILAGFSPLFYNMVSSYDAQYSFDYQYPITLLPFLFYSSIYGLKKLEGYNFRYGDYAALKMIKKTFALFCILLVMYSALHYYRKYTGPFKSKNWRNLSFYSVLGHTIKPKIPVSSKLFAVSNLQPHFIEYAYAGMYTLDLDYRQQPDNTFYILTKDIPLAFTKEQGSRYNQAVINLQEKLTPVYEDDKFIVLKKP